MFDLWDPRKTYDSSFGLRGAGRLPRFPKLALYCCLLPAFSCKRLKRCETHYFSFGWWNTGWPYQQCKRSLYSPTTQILKACYHLAFSCNSGMLKRRVLALVDEKQVVYKRVNTSLINNEGAAAIVLSYYPDCKACYLPLSLLLRNAGM